MIPGKFCIFAVFLIDRTWALKLLKPNFNESGPYDEVPNLPSAVSKEAVKRFDPGKYFHDDPRCGFDLSLMAECCNVLYREHPWCGCWAKVQQFQAPFLVKAAVFEYDNYCLLGLSGQVDGDERWEKSQWEYLSKHDAVVSEDLCGKQAVRGFVENSKEFFRLPGWKLLAETLGSPQCNKGVSVVGTSWGAAFAELFVGCANSGKVDEIQGPGLPKFRVDRLYTFGAPPTSREPVSDSGTSNACILGQRVFRASNTSVGSSDMITYSTAASGFYHARQEAVQLVELPNGKFEAEIWPCEASGTANEPSWSTVRPYVERVMRENGTKSFDEFAAGHHKIAEYISILSKVDDTSPINDTSKVGTVLAPFGGPGDLDTEDSIRPKRAATTTRKTNRSDGDLDQEPDQTLRAVALEFSEFVAGTSFMEA